MMTALENNPVQRIAPNVKFNMAVAAIKRQQTLEKALAHDPSRQQASDALAKIH